VQRRPGGLHRFADDPERIAIGAGNQALRADMKGEADLTAIGAGRPQKLCGIGGLGAELSREMEEGALHRRRLESHDDADPFPAGLVDDIRQLLLGSTTKVSTL
jgi:hypothetical protein